MENGWLKWVNGRRVERRTGGRREGKRWVGSMLRESVEKGMLGNAHSGCFKDTALSPVSVSGLGD